MTLYVEKWKGHQPCWVEKSEERSKTVKIDFTWEIRNRHQSTLHTAAAVVAAQVLLCTKRSSYCYCYVEYYRLQRKSWHLHKLRCTSCNLGLLQLHEAFLCLSMMMDWIAFWFYLDPFKNSYQKELWTPFISNWPFSNWKEPFFVLLIVQIRSLRVLLSENWGS